MRIIVCVILFTAFAYGVTAQTRELPKPIYTSGFIYELRDSLHYFAVKDGINIYGYKLINPLGLPVHESRGRSSYIAMFKLPQVTEGPYLLMLKTDDAYYAHRVYVWPR